MKKFLLMVYLITASITAIANTTYGSDSNGNRWEVTTNPNTNTAYGSDSSGRHWEISKNPNTNTTYGSDSNGNRWETSSY